jgi:spore coat protein CotH
MTLNAMQQDGSKLHEFGAYALFNAMGLPASKTGWARVYINGVDKGLYLNVETIDDIFISKRFKDNTQHLYEGVALKDFKPGNADGDKNSGSFLVDEGWKKVPNKNDLNTMINALNTSDNAKWWARLNTYWNRAELINHMAVENFLGHWDGYSGPIINNYFVRSNAAGKFSMIPWGLDQTFGENRNPKLKGLTYSFSMLAPKVGFPWISEMPGKPKTMDRGLLYQRCIAYTTCKVAYLKALKAVSAKATSMKLVSKMKAAAALTKDLRTGLVAAVTTNTYQFVTNQQAAVTKLLKANGIK